MGYWDQDERERRDEERRQYSGDVFYEAWRRGIDPDRASECASDCYYDGKSASECVDGTARDIRREREARQAQQDEAEYYAQMEREAQEEAERLADETTKGGA